MAVTEKSFERAIDWLRTNHYDRKNHIYFVLFDKDKQQHVGWKLDKVNPDSIVLRRTILQDDPNKQPVYNHKTVTRKDFQNVEELFNSIQMSVSKEFMLKEYKGLNT